MLADYMARMSRGKPDRRYALDPAHQAAINNFIAMRTRSVGTPYLLQLAEPEVEQHFAGKDLATFQDLMSLLHNEHDPVGLSALDLHEESLQGKPFKFNSALKRLFDHLRGIHGELSARNIPRRFNTTVLTSEPLKQLVSGEYHSTRQTSEPAVDLVQYLGHMAHRLGDANTEATTDYLHDAAENRNDPSAFVGMYDLAHSLLHDPRHSGHAGFVDMLRKASQAALDESIVPHLMGSSNAR